jgi:hypothetical protein
VDTIAFGVGVRKVSWPDGYHQSTKAHFNVTKLPLDHPKRMLNLGPCLSFAVLDLALGFVQQAAFIQLGIGAAARCDLPDHLTTFMLFTLLDTGVCGVLPQVGGYPVNTETFE